jgi:hypothetical protein
MFCYTWLFMKLKVKKQNKKFKKETRHVRRRIGK